MLKCNKKNFFCLDGGSVVLMGPTLVVLVEPTEFKKSSSLAKLILAICTNFLHPGSLCTGVSRTPVWYLHVTMSASVRSGSIQMLRVLNTKIAALGLSADLSYVMKWVSSFS